MITIPLFVFIILSILAALMLIIIIIFVGLDIDLQQQKKRKKQNLHIQEIINKELEVRRAQKIYDTKPKDHVVKVTITAKIRVNDCDSYEDAQNYIDAHYLYNLDKIFDVTMEEIS